MKKREILTKTLAIAGTVLLWIPILLTIVTSVVGTIISRTFLLDYLMPADCSRCPDRGHPALLPPRCWRGPIADGSVWGLRLWLPPLSARRALP